MTRRDRLILLLALGSALPVAGALMGGCMQSYDPSTDKGSGTAAVTGSSTGSASSCAPGVVCADPSPTQCALDSPECFYLCGSPLCALGNDPVNPDAGAPIPAASATPPIFLGSTDTQIQGDGGTTPDPCVQIESQAVLIRSRSCAPCHQTQGSSTKVGCECPLSYILDDQQIATNSSPATGIPYILPGQPEGSYIYQRIQGNTMPPSPSIAEGLIGVEAGAAIVYPTPEDQSVLYEWIQNCVVGADGGAYSSSAYGGGLNGSTCFGACDGGGTGPADAATAPATAAIVDAGGGKG